MRNLLAGFGLLTLLTGCGLPPALSVASTVADGFSYVVSGKSVSDHALSMVASRDCAMMRVLDGREICTDVATEESTVLLAAAPAPAAEPWTPVEPVKASLPADMVHLSPPTAAASSARAVARFGAATPLAKPSTAQPEEDVTVATVTVIGSYRDRANAERELVRLARLRPRLVTVAAARGALYRVVTDVAVAQARATGIADAWPVRADIRLAASL